MSGEDDNAFWAIEGYNDAVREAKEIRLSLNYLEMKLREAENSKFTKN